jgi:hypothetical protein
MIRKHLRLRRLVVALAFAAVAVPVAQAEPNLGGSPSSTGVVQTIPLVSEHGQTSVRLSQLQIEGLRWQAMAKAYQDHPGITAAGAALTNAKHTALPVPVTSTSQADDFSWNDFGVGALVAFGMTLVLLISVTLGRRYRSRSERAGLARA